jgi:hypothetical protein
MSFYIVSAPGIRLPSVLFACVSMALPSVSVACSSCGCTLNSDWASQGYTASSGIRIGVRYDYFDQTQLRSGTQSASASSFTAPSEQEVQRETTNHNTTLNLDYAFSRTWGVDLQLPYFDRPHSTVAEGDTEISTSSAHGLGDVRILARYQGFAPDLTWGVQFGLKLPTGGIDQNFAGGPRAGELLDRGLQLGTGTTDLLVGVYNFGGLGGHFSYFAQALLQKPVNFRTDFRPGTGLNVNFGVRYRQSAPLVPVLQFNVRVEGRERGSQADIKNSGATLAYVSPGLIFHFGSRLEGFTFLQVPMYQRVNGLQLEPTHFISAGFSYRY